MSAVRKSVADPAPIASKSPQTTRELDGRCRACHKALAEAETALHAASAAVNEPHDDDPRRALELAAEHNAKLRLDKARKELAEHQEALAATKRQEDAQAASELSKRLCGSALNREAEELADAFDTLVIDGLRKFFVMLADRRARALTDAKALNELWARLGHEHHLDVDREPGSGTQGVPHRVSIERLAHVDGKIAARARQRLATVGQGRVERAVAWFVSDAFDHARSTGFSGNVAREIHELAFDQANGGKP